MLSGADARLPAQAAKPEVQKCADWFQESKQARPPAWQADPRPPDPAARPAPTPPRARAARPRSPALGQARRRTFRKERNLCATFPLQQAARQTRAALRPRARGRRQRPGVDTRALTSEYYGRVHAVYKKHDCNPVLALLPIMLQAPVFVGAFSALNALAAYKVRAPAVGLG